MTDTEITNAEETTLVENARRNPAAFAGIYDQFFPQIFKYILYRVRDRQTAEDLTALAFERAIIDLPRYDPRKAPLGAWIFGIARHLVSDHFRERKRRPWLPLTDDVRPASEKAEPENAAIRGETRALLLAALERLTDRQRDLLALKFSGRLTNRRIAGLTGLKESHVAVLVFRALQRLRQELQEGDGNE